MTFTQRLTCANKAAEGQTDAEIAQTLGWSKWSVRKWRRVYEQHGEDGLVTRMGRPAGGPLSTFALEMRDELEKMRRTHPGWGPVTLVEELARAPRFLGLRLPSRAQVAVFLKAKDLPRPYQRRAGLPLVKVARAKQVHQEWEMDAQGAQPVGSLGQISIVNILDVISRLKVGSYTHPGARGLDGRDYQLVLRMAFLEYGLPGRISLDHDSAFFDNTSPSPYPSRLQLWLTALDVQVVFIQKAPPLEHAKIERNHQTMSAQAITGQGWTDLMALGQALGQHPEFLNTRYPSRSLHYQSPLEAYPQAIHSERPYRPEWKEQMLNLQRVYIRLAQGRWFRETSCHAEFWLGLQRYNAGRKCAKSTLEITFDPARLEFVSQKLGTDEVRQYAPKGLTKTDLMGELTPLARLPVYQLALPLSREAWRAMELSRMIGGTSL